MIVGLRTSRLETGSGRAAKRCLDLVVGIPLALLSTPVLVFLVVAVKATSRGPAFFAQERVGRNGKTFRVYKLRTMRRTAEDELHADKDLHQSYRDEGYKLHLDPRVTRLGHHLRRSSLDELPQLFQVVLGQMSMVGPRPVLREELEALYGPEAALYLIAKPGVTGAWQVSGRSNVRGRDRVRLDAAYVENWSIGLDVSIVLKTIPTVLGGKGAV